MDIVTGVASLVFEKILENPVRFIGRHLGYLIDYQTNKQKLTDRVPKLNTEISRIQRSAREDQRNIKELEKSLTDWISEAERKVQAAKDVIDDRGHENAKCSCNGSFPNLVSRYKLSKKAKLMEEDIRIILQKADKFGKYAYRLQLQPSFKNKDFAVFGSRTETLKEIMEALKDPQLLMIGVYGMGGIGKTTLVTEVARQAKEGEDCFSDVVIVTVSREFNPKEIQQGIAEVLGLRFEGEILSNRAKELRKRLRNEKKILIILDDIWSKLDLSEVGISFEAGDQKECKILLVSRDRGVLSDLMGVKKIIEIKVLSDSEAEGLFNTFVGDKPDNSDFKELANQVVGECGGLPIAIVTIARSLKNKDLFVWKDFLSRLKSSSVDEKVHSSIKMSYDFLEGEEEKKLLLLCSLHGEDANVRVDDLMFYGIGWDLFQGVHTMEEARRAVHSLVDKLKDHCLLLDGDAYYEGTVKMHDVIRDVMISIAKKDEHMHCLTKVADLEDCLHKEDFRDLEEYSKAIMLLGPDFNNQLLPSLVCPKLQLLLSFDRNAYVRFLPPVTIDLTDDFFKEAQELKALSFYCNPLQSLPQSFCTLRHLRALRLRLGNNEDLTLIGELRNLIALDLSRSSFSQLPEHIGKLTRLRSLNLSYCKSLKVIQPNVISSLVRLEELYMDEVDIDWEVEGRVGEGRNASLTEFKKLRYLATLHLNVRDANALPKDMFSENLQRYRIKINARFYIYRDFTGSRLLYLSLRESSQLRQYGIEKLMKNSEGLWLEEFHGVDNIVYELDGFPQLKNFCLKNNDEVRYIVHSTEEIQPCSAFQNLETLNLENLRNLEKICYNNVTMESFSKLRRIDVRNCDKLKNLFSFSIARKFEEIKVSECRMMEMLVYHGSEDAAHGNINNEAISEKLEFPQLRALKLDSLSNLIFFWSRLETTCGSSLSDSPQPLFGEKVVFPILKELELSVINFRELWSTTSCMQNLSSLDVSSCPNLKYLFTVAMAEKLAQLETLEICGCPVMEEVVVPNEHREGRLEKTLFPKLKYLALEDLPNLRRFCTGDCIECPSLLELEIKNCGVLRKFISSNEEEVEGPFVNEKVVFPSLKELKLSGMDFRELWSTPSCMQKYLSSLDVSSCPNLKYLFTVAMAGKLAQLETLKICGCPVMEEVVFTNEHGEGRLEKNSFPKLKHLELEDLSNLRRFCTGDCIECPSLLKLEIKNCGEPRKFISSNEEEVEGPFFNEKVSFPILEELRLERVNLKILWADQLSITSFGMQTLKRLYIKNYDSLSHLFSLDVPRSLLQLEELRLWDCKDMEEVFVTKEPIEEGTPQKISFPKLKHLKLEDLSNLRRFFTGDCIECPSLLKLEIKNCGELRKFISSNEEEVEGPFFNEKVVFPSLKELKLSGMDFRELWSTTSCMQKYLSSLDVSSCPNLKYLFTVAMAGKLAQLETLKICGCPVMEEVVVTNEHGEGRLEKNLFPKLKHLKLEDLSNLRRFCTGDCIECPSLLKLEIKNCGELRKFISSNEEEVEGPFFNEKVVFPSLKELKLSGMDFRELWSTTSCMQKYLSSLDVSSCPNLKYLFTVAMAGKLAQLETLKICGCPVMEEVVVTNEHGEGRLEKNLFPKLKHLKLEDLSNLRRFCTGDCIECPSLLKLEIKNCGELRKFISSNEEEVEGPFFNEKVSFPILEELRLERVNLKILWADQLSTTSFGMQNLKRLYIKNCDSLSHLFSLDVARSLLQLEMLDLWDCKDMEEVFATKEPIEEGTPQKISFPKLKNIWLWNLQNIRRFCAGCCIEFPSLTNMIISGNGASRELMGSEARQTFFNGKVAFPKLEVLSVKDLNSVNYLFSFAVAKSLVTLRMLEVGSCSLMEEIVQVNEQGEEGRLDKISFPKLERIDFYDLSNLKRFYGGACIEFPSLLKLPAEITDRVVLGPNLEELATTSSELIKEVCDCQYSRAPPFCNVKVVDLECFRNEPIGFSLKCIQRYQNLESLSLSGFFVDTTYHHQQLMVSSEEHERPLKRLKKLTLFQLSMLTRLYEDSEDFENSSLESLKFLRVQECNRLKSPLLSSTTSFQNLMVLVVSECSAMINLLASSTARSLVHLRFMSITECKQMTEIITGEIVDDEIVFGKLEILELNDLPSLRSFHSAGNSVMRFPNLVMLVVSQCPEMRRFSFGTIDAPKLGSIISETEKIEYTWDSLDESDFEESDSEESDLEDLWSEPQRKLWEGDINKTLEKLWEEDSLVMQRLFTET